MTARARTSSLIAALAIVAALVPIAAADAETAPPVPTRAPALKLPHRHTAGLFAKRSTRRSHRRALARASFSGPQFRSPGGHIYAPSVLVCNGRLIGGNGFYAETDYNDKWISVTNTLLTWSGSYWYVRQTHPQVGAQGMASVTDMTQWLIASNGANVTSGFGAAPVFTFDTVGYHAIQQEIRWYKRSTLVDSVTVTLRDSFNGYTCYAR